MKRTIIALLSCVGLAGAEVLTTPATMDEQEAAVTASTATHGEDMFVTLYQFGDGFYIGGITNAYFVSALEDSNRYITIATRIKPTDTDGVETIFGYEAGRMVLNSTLKESAAIHFQGGSG